MLGPLVLCLLQGCSETNVTALEFGELQVSPESLTLEGGCGYEERTVTLSSVGEFPLEITSIALQGDGWALLEVPTLPLRLPPGEAFELLLLGNEGDAQLTIQTHEPGSEGVVIPLVGDQNAAPTVSWISPVDGAVVEPGAELVVAVDDAHDATDELVVRWTSDLDGTLGAGVGDAEGLARTTWADATGGEQVLTAQVTDTCGTSTSASIQVCRQEGYLSDDLDLSTWTMDGSARFDQDNNWVELTNVDGTFQLGSAFQTTATRGDDVQLAFSFYVSGGTGADGFAVTALDTSRADTYVAQSGGCLGYGGGGVCGDFEPLYGWNVEVDTYYSAGLDPTDADHLSFHFDGDVAGYEVFAALPEMEDDSWHEMSIQVVAPRVTIAVDGVVYIDQDIDGHYDFPAEVGFTAATGGETNYHLIRGLAVIEDVCE